VPQDHTTADLTPAEQLLIRRRRLGCTQKEMAMKLHVTISVYQGMEDATLVVPMNLRMRGMLRPWEWCYICRRRSGLKRWQIAHIIGRTEWWVTKMESGRAPCRTLIKFWTAQESTREA
jgi:hypothetical protein